MKVRYVLPLTAVLFLTEPSANIEHKIYQSHSNDKGVKTVFNTILSNTIENILSDGRSFAQQIQSNLVVDYESLAQRAEKIGPINNYKLVIDLLKPYAESPDNLSSHFFNELAVAYKYNGNLNLAEKYYIKSIELKPFNLAPRFNLGILYLKGLKETDKALEQFEYILSNIDKNNKPAKFYIIEIKKGRF